MNGECVIWGGPVSTTGYGRTGRDYAHRLSYIARHGEIPLGQHIHHVCENRLCVNADHLLAVTPQEHRDIHQRDTCRSGLHLLTEENSYRRTRGGGRECVACARDRAVKRIEQHTRGTEPRAHGTHVAYQAHGCRCQTCRAFIAEYARKRRAKKKAA